MVVDMEKSLCTMRCLTGIESPSCCVVSLGLPDSVVTLPRCTHIHGEGGDYHKYEAEKRLDGF